MGTANTNIIYNITGKYEKNKASVLAALFIPCCGTHKHTRKYFECVNGLL